MATATRIEESSVVEPPVGHATARKVLAVVLGGAGPVWLLTTQGFHGRAMALAGICAAWGVLVGWALAGSGLRRAVLAVAGVAVLALTHPNMGRAPALVALVGISVAWAILVDWSPFRSHPARRVTVAGLAIPVLAMAEVLWIRREAATVTLVAMAAAMAVVELYHLVPRPMEKFDAVARRVVRSLADAVGITCLAIVALPVLYLPGALANLFSRTRRNAAWTPVDTPLVDLVRDADRPFVTEPRPARQRRVAVGATVLTAAAALLAFALLRPAPTTTPRVSTHPGAVFDSSAATPFSQLPAYEGASFADQLQAEHVGLAGSIRTDTVTYTALPDLDGRFTTVHSGTREVIPPPACPCKEAAVWLVGGQAAFGWGQRDQATIAAQLVRDAADDGYALEVTNLAVPGWTLWQQYLAVTARLAGTPDRPQLVIFYGGFEDVAGTLVSAALRGPEDPFPAMLASEDVIAFEEGDTDVTDAGGGAALGRRAAERLLGLQGVIETQLWAQDIRTLFVLEPDALATNPGGSGPMAAGWHRDLADRGGFAAAMDATRTVLGTRVVDLRGLLSDQPRPVFSDLVNTNEDGAAMVAAALLGEMEPILAEVAP